MGVIYEGPYADQIDSYSHEGYVVARTAQGDDCGPSIWEAYEDSADHLAAACECHWRGDGRHPVSDDGAELAKAEWRERHIQPMIDRAMGAWPAWGERVATLGREAARHAAGGRYLDAADTLTTLTALIAERQHLINRAVVDGHLIEQRTSTPERQWTTDQVLQWLADQGRPVARDTWTGYVSRGQAPAPTHRVGRTPVWDPDQIRAWHNARRGQGWRATTS